MYKELFSRACLGNIKDSIGLKLVVRKLAGVHVVVKVEVGAASHGGLTQPCRARKSQEVELPTTKANNWTKKEDEMETGVCEETANEIGCGNQNYSWIFW
ncbi:hypothetical protein E3N88_13908 [Mikania micrantha]|uniref:Uncharacterized protein n=1 Tax=Mikania micrantha TaxID=192012 RepID=A0A5N6P156_9ASTR|nr:hypothetical protein E3N88_13908 [Mikania micrantha]